MHAYCQDANTVELMAQNKDEEQFLVNLKNANVFGNFRMTARRAKVEGLVSPYFDNTYFLTIHINSNIKEQGKNAN
jgi:hypothetical protein